ncbi:multidrug transporter [Brevibacterium sandarakinum]|nr:multidrug transporter [Brevibacterium sandarakinum]
MTDTDRSHTAAPALIGALLHLAAKDADLGSTASSALSPQDSEILTEVEVALRNQMSDEHGVKQALAEVAGSIASVRSSPRPVSLTAAKYEKHRTAALRQLGVASAKGASVWPPTSQTAVQRFGSWNEALKVAGLATSAVGRARGQLRFDEAAYNKAIAAFVADCDDRDLGATYKAYGDYAAEHKGEVPSAAAVRKFYGSWNAALASAG